MLFNGDGCEYQAHISHAGKKNVSVKIALAAEQNRESGLDTHLGIVLSKGDRFEYALQKATELGVTRITPLFSQRSEVQLKGDRLEKKQNQWQAVCISACEQCQRNQIPEVLPAQNLAEWIKLQADGLRLVLHHRAARPMNKFSPENQQLTLLVGPEGGLTEAEIDQAHATGFQSCLIGPRVLRTETAPLAALAVAQQLWGDFT